MQTITEIARDMGLSRPTVRKHLSTVEEPKYIRACELALEGGIVSAPIVMNELRRLASRSRRGFVLTLLIFALATTTSRRDREYLCFAKSTRD